MSLSGAVWMADLNDNGLKHLKTGNPGSHDRDFKRVPGVQYFLIMVVRIYPGIISVLFLP
jgi:hypothetical protein